MNHTKLFQNPATRQWEIRTFDGVAQTLYVGDTVEIERDGEPIATRIGFRNGEFYSVNEFVTLQDNTPAKLLTKGKL